MGYQPQAIDTSAEADRLLFALLRQRSNGDRLQMAMQQNRGARHLFLTGLKRRFGQLTADKVAQASLKDAFPQGFEPDGDEMTWIQDPIDLTLSLHSVFKELQVAYYISGGVAAIFYGEYRTTQDADLVINIATHAVPTLTAALEGLGFYISGIDNVVSSRLNTFQAIHQQSLGKADLTIAGTDEFEIAKLARRRLEQISGRGELPFISPEDLVLSKLQWQRSSQSEKQWRDVLGVLKVQAQALNLTYMHHWAIELDLQAELAAALVAAGLQ
ncbi:MAG: hypothetical protein AAF622_18885 [Cyanobacteria bacterium P01_C01_bin.147]